MTDRLKEPLPCPCCDQEMIPVDTYNNKVLWQHPSNRCALIYVSLNNSYRVELWNTRPREAKLEAQIERLRQGLETAERNLTLMNISGLERRWGTVGIIRDALKGEPND